MQLITLLFPFTVHKFIYPPVSKVHAGSFRVSVTIHRTLTWTTGTLTCVRNHCNECVYARGLGTPSTSQHILDTKKPIFFVLLTGLEPQSYGSRCCCWSGLSSDSQKWYLESMYLYIFRPDITVMVGWALKINYLSIYLYIYMYSLWRFPVMHNNTNSCHLLICKVGTPVSEIQVMYLYSLCSVLVTNNKNKSTVTRR